MGGQLSIADISSGMILDFLETIPGLVNYEENIHVEKWYTNLKTLPAWKYAQSVGSENGFFARKAKFNAQIHVSGRSLEKSVIYWHPLSPPALATVITAKLCDADVRLRYTSFGEKNEPKSEWYRKINPNGQVPAYKEGRFTASLNEEFFFDVFGRFLNVFGRFWTFLRFFFKKEI